ncbi:MAG TPA: transglycosylase SLT domain-containing protein [Ignavibacteriaceae bacterium]|jgi:Rod binding domain-containing protein|nr:transglycosylase SLT domain-containing protein [Ignavibacteriaceae bacterium]
MDLIDLKVTDDTRHVARPQKVGLELDEAGKKKLAKTTKDFESLLTSMMLKSMTKTTGGLFGEDSYGGDVLDTLFESEIASYISKSRGLGIAESIYEKLTGEKFPETYISRIRSIQQSNTPSVDLGNLPSGAIAPSKSALGRLERFQPIIKSASRAYGVDESIIKSIILAESAANEKAISKASAKGLMQLMDGTANDMGVRNVWDPAENINGGTKYFAQMLRQYNGDLKLALAAYNAGPGNVNKYNGIPPFEETKTYVARVMGYINFLEI